MDEIRDWGYDTLSAISNYAVTKGRSLSENDQVGIKAKIDEIITTAR